MSDTNAERTTRGYHKGWKSLYHKCGLRERRDYLYTDAFKLEMAVKCSAFWAKRGIDEPIGFRSGLSFGKSCE